MPSGILIHMAFRAHRGHRVASSSVSISSLQSQSPVPAGSVPSSDPTPGTPAEGGEPAATSADKHASAATAAAPAENGTATPSRSSTPPASGATTPTKATQQRKSRAFLDLAPLTGFLTLRGRGAQKPPAPAPPPVKETPDSDVGAQGSAEGGATARAAANGSASAAVDGACEDAEGAEDEDDSDRRTIRGGAASGTEDEGVGEGKVAAAATANGDARRRAKGGPFLGHRPVLSTEPLKHANYHVWQSWPEVDARRRALGSALHKLFQDRTLGGGDLPTVGIWSKNCPSTCHMNLGERVPY